METQQIFFFGLSILGGVLFFIYLFEFTPKSIFKEYFLIFSYAIIGLILFVIIDIIFLGYKVSDILLGRILFMHMTPIIVCYSALVFVLLSVVNDLIYPFIHPLIVKLKINNKFRTPKVKREKN